MWMVEISETGSLRWKLLAVSRIEARGATLRGLQGAARS
jgi:hypothetical protein